MKLEVQLPNIKKLFIPDPGMMIADIDLKRADVQIVAAEANEPELKKIFRDNYPIYEEYTALLGCNRQGAKMAVHLTDYGGTPRTLSKAIGCTVHIAETFQRSWFSRFPGIKDWHARVEDSIQTTRSVENIFGYKVQFFDRIENTLSEALAWIPQSTVALIIAKAILNSERYEPIIQLLTQVHDSGVWQFPIPKQQECLMALHRCFQVVCPYDDPLIIGSDCEISTSSYGEVKPYEAWGMDDGRSLEHLDTGYLERSWI